MTAGRRGAPLRFALLTNSDGIERWLADAIAQVAEAGEARCVALIRADPPLPMPNRADSLAAVARTPQHWAHFALRATLLRTDLTTSLPIEEVLPGVPVQLVEAEQSGAVVRLGEESVAVVRQRSLDFILLGELGILKGDALTASRLGVWSFHHGDPRRYRGRPSCFWELHDRAPSVSAGIQRLTETLDGGHFMGLVTVETEPSFGGTMSRLYAASTGLLGTVAAYVREHGRLPPAVDLPDPLPPVHRRPRNRDVIRAIGVVLRWRLGRQRGGLRG